MAAVWCAAQSERRKIADKFVLIRAHFYGNFLSVVADAS